MPISGGGGGGGGAQPAHGALIELNNDTSYANGDTVKCDIVMFDTDNYYSAASGVFTIPAGKGGQYYVVVYAESATLGLTAFSLKVHTSAASANVVFPGAPTSPGVLDLSGSTLMKLAAGDTFHFSVGDAGADPISLVGGQTGFGLSMFGS